jgi:hypothetical protein
MTITIQELLGHRGTPLDAQALSFEGVEGHDVYNISRPVGGADGPVLAGRVEKRDSERSIVVFFQPAQQPSVWQRTSLPTFELQDPFVTRVDGDVVLGGVEITENPARSGRARDSATADWYSDNTFVWRTRLFRGSSLGALAPMLDGPWGMKDLRLVQLPDGRIGVFTRPQGGAAGRGMIGFDIAATISEIDIDFIAAAPLWDDMYVPEEWGGANDAWILDESRVGVLGHIARFVGDVREYYPLTFEVDLRTRRWSSPRIAFARSDLPPGPAKRPDLVDVVFPGGLVPDVADGKRVARVYCGVGDAQAQVVTIAWPFSRWPDRPQEQ